MKKMKSGMSVPNGGAEGLPGAKKNKEMNAYANGGKVGMKKPIVAKENSGRARGAGKATKGFDFKVD